MRQRGGFYLSLLFFLVFMLLPQQLVYSSVNDDEQLSLVGITLAELIERFGAPVTVVAVRGEEHWQDDVVFQYSQGDFYIYRDRVWQVRLASACGIAGNDRKAAVLLTLGDTAEDKGDYVLFRISGRDWPLMLRVNFNNSGRVTAIYIYRPDF